MNLPRLIKQLRKERDRACEEVERFEQALAAIEKVGAKGLRVDSHGIRKTTRTMSVAGRRKIAAAQRARWAVWRKARAGKAKNA